LTGRAFKLTSRAFQLRSRVFPFSSVLIQNLVRVRVRVRVTELKFEEQKFGLHLLLELLGGGLFF
jgi:hypothetical protein